MNGPRVRRLPEHVANQIAAGEVVARPASVVKELVENALDAQAGSLSIAIEGGGVTLIRVVDDGLGMDRADALAALERHATSKLRTADDLRTIATLGFRGEALPSIASVSRFELRTRRRSDDEGTTLRVEGNGRVDARPCGTAVGTTVEVRDLFFNVPARRKFLRALATESAHVGEAVRETAFAHPNVQFELWRDGRLHRRWLRATSLEERARDILGDDLTLRVAEQRGPMRIEAYLSPPERVRSGATGLTILVNRRPIQDRAIARAVAAAYGDRIERGKYPLGVVMLELPTEACDVNVHPQKAEVRFAEPRAVSDAVFSSVQRALALADTTGSGTGARSGARERGTAPEPHRSPTAAGVAPFALQAGEPPEPWSWPDRDASRRTSGLPGSGGAARPMSVVPNARGPESSVVLVAALDDVWIARNATGVLFVDRRAAEARVLAARVRRSLAIGSLPSQPLLFPLRFDAPPERVARLEALVPSLERLGFDVRAIGPRTFVVNGVARAWSRASAESLVALATSDLDALIDPSGRERILDQASHLAASPEPLPTAEAQMVLDEWCSVLGDADPRDAAETLAHVATSSLAPRTPRA